MGQNSSYKIHRFPPCQSWLHKRDKRLRQTLNIPRGNLFAVCHYPIFLCRISHLTDLFPPRCFLIISCRIFNEIKVTSSSNESNLRNGLLIFPTHLVEMFNVTDGFGSISAEKALEMVPMGHFSIKHGRLDKIEAMFEVKVTLEWLWF